MPAAVSDTRVAEYKEAFTLFDADGDGCITTKELGTVMRALGKSPTDAEVQRIIKEIDPDGRGVVDFTEFVSVMSRDVRDHDGEADLRSAWKVFDKEGKGWLPAAEIKHVMSSIGEKLSPDEMSDLLKEADPTSSGKILADDFIKMLMAR